MAESNLSVRRTKSKFTFRRIRIDRVRVGAKEFVRMAPSGTDAVGCIFQLGSSKRPRYFKDTDDLWAAWRKLGGRVPLGLAA
jgi:hypothetical protein